MRKHLLVFLVLIVTTFVARSDELALRLPSGVEITSLRYPVTGSPSGGPLLLWLGTGQTEAENHAAAYLAEHGFETWYTDLYAPWFLPALPSSAAQVPAADLADWLDTVAARFPGRDWRLVSAGHMAEPTLRGLAAWQQRHAQATVPQVVLLFPMLYRGVEAGSEPEYATVVGQIRARITILQPKSSAGFWWRERLKARLEAAGSQVGLTILPGLRDGYYRRTDITEAEQAAAAHLGATVLDAINNLSTNASP